MAGGGSLFDAHFPRRYRTHIHEKGTPAMRPAIATLAGVFYCCIVTAALAQEAPRPAAAATQPTTRPRGPFILSPQLLPDRRITFRLLAPTAQSVQFSGGDIPN